MNTPAPAAAPVLYFNAGNGVLDKEAARRQAIELATKITGHDPQLLLSAQEITAFDREYTAFNKILPVWRIEYPAMRLYINPASRRVAAQFADGWALEKWTFDYLHKWQFLDALGPDKWARDGIMVAFVLGNAVVALLGLTLFVRTRRRLNVK